MPMCYICLARLPRRLSTPPLLRCYEPGAPCVCMWPIQGISHGEVPATHRALHPGWRTGHCRPQRLRRGTPSRRPTRSEMRRSRWGRTFIQPRHSATVLAQGPLGCLLAKVAQGIQLIVLIACIVLSQKVSLALPGFYFESQITKFGNKISKNNQNFLK